MCNVSTFSFVLVGCLLLSAPATTSPVPDSRGIIPLPPGLAYGGIPYGSVSETVPENGANKKIDLNQDSKPLTRRQNNGGPGDGGGGEEIDLSVIPNVGNNNLPGQQPNFPGQQPNIPGQQPNIPGQSPFFNTNPFFQQPFLNNGFGFPQGVGLGGFPQGAGGNFNPNGIGNFPQGVPPFAFQQGFGQPSRNNVVLQNNGKQYLVQALTPEQQIIQKNGKQYLLQPISSNNAALTAANNVPGNIPNFNIPNSLFSPFGQTSPLNSVGPGASGFNNIGFPGPFSPAVAAVRPTALASNAKLTSTAPGRVIVQANGQKLEVEQIPLRNGGSSPYLSSAVGAVAAQLAASGSGRQYAYRYQPIPLSDAYSRANEAGYGLFPINRNDSEQKKRDTKSS